MENPGHSFRAGFAASGTWQHRSRGHSLNWGVGVVSENAAVDVDVVVIGGGPAGSTVGSILKKYRPDLKVLILEKEKFPREHVGESQLPAIGPILNEMGCWEKVESAGFPIKIGGTYRWGSSKELWAFEFFPTTQFKDEPRPAQYHGQRVFTAFQVDRAIYDKILLDHTAELGCEVREETQVTRVDASGGHVNAIYLQDGTCVRAKYYVDCSGYAGVLRRANDIKIDVPSKLKNMAIWDYWDNADWAVEIGVGATRVEILSIAAGWIWFIPLGPTRTSIGYICPVEHYKKMKMKPEELYDHALAQEPRVQELCKNAKRDGEIRTTKDWSYVAEKMVGDNWFLAGESAGFADPILAGGMTLAHSTAREVAYIILADYNKYDQVPWLKNRYEEITTRRIRQYIRFADYWYFANGQFTDLEDLTKEIAASEGLKMTSKEAFRWLSLGGFSDEDFFLPGLGGLDLVAVKEVARRLSVDSDKEVEWEVAKFNTFKLNLTGAKRETLPLYNNGQVHKVEAYRRGLKLLPKLGQFKDVMDLVSKHSDISEFMKASEALLSRASRVENKQLTLQQWVATLEMMLVDGWVTGKFNPKRPRIRFDFTGGDPNLGIRDIDGTLRLKYHDGVAEKCDSQQAKASS